MKDDATLLRTNMGTPSYIQDIGLNKIVIVCLDKNKTNILCQWGAKKRFFSRRYWELPFQGNDELAEKLSQLNRADFYFASQEAGWPPAAVFKELRLRGQVSGRINEITWVGPPRGIKLSHNQ